MKTTRDFALAIRGRREHLGMSQTDLAGAAGVSRKWVSDFETGKSGGYLTSVLRVLDVLGIDLDASADGVPLLTWASNPIDLDDILDEYRSP